MYIITKVLGFLQVRGIIAVIAILLLLWSSINNVTIAKDNRAKDIKISEYASTIASYKSVVSNDTAVAKVQSSECAAMLKEQVQAALEAKPVDSGKDPFFKIEDFIK